MPGSTGCTKPTASQGRSSKPPAGHMGGASSSIWRGSTTRRSQSRRDQRVWNKSWHHRVAKCRQNDWLRIGKVLTFGISARSLERADSRSNCCGKPIWPVCLFACAARKCWFEVHRRRQALHSFPLSRWLMGILCSVIRPATCVVPPRNTKFAQRRAVGSELVGHDGGWSDALLL
jgi:hypothetical protein